MPEAYRQQRERYIASIMGGVGCTGLFVLNVAIDGRPIVSSLCLLSTAYLVGGAAHDGQELARQRDASSQLPLSDK